MGAFADSPGPYGAFDQGGNVWQWEETAVGSSRETRGGSFADVSANLDSLNPNDVPPTLTDRSVGFRVAYVPASVPESGELALLLAGAVSSFLSFNVAVSSSFSRPLSRPSHGDSARSRCIFVRGDEHCAHPRASAPARQQFRPLRMEQLGREFCSQGQPIILTQMFPTRRWTRRRKSGTREVLAARWEHWNMGPRTPP